MAVENEFKESTVTTTNHTVNYDLPLWAGDDATSWLTQVNDAMNKIDSGIYEAKQSSHEVVTIAENAQKLAEETKAESDASAKIVKGYEGRLKTVEDTTAEHTTDLTNLSQRVDTQDTEIHSLQEVDKTVLTDIGTLQTGQGSLTADIEELQNEITQVGRVLKKLGSVEIAYTSVTSESGCSSLNFGGLIADVYGNGTVIVTTKRSDVKLSVITSPPNYMEIYNLLPAFNQLFVKVKELYENNNLTIASPRNTVNILHVSNSSGGSGGIKETSGYCTAYINANKALSIVNTVMLEASGARVIGWQPSATYNILIMPSFTYYAYEEV